MIMLTEALGSHTSWKVMKFKKGVSRPGKSWKITVVLESCGIPTIGHGIFNRMLIILGV